MKCYSFDKNDFLLLLVIYDTTYILIKSFTNFVDLTCLNTALLVSLAVIFFMTIFHIKQVKQSFSLENKGVEIKIKNQIGTEYRKAHFLRKIKNLVLRARMSSPKEDFSTKDPDYKVHMFYLNRAGTSDSPDLKN
jgi:hypothetical protein